MSRHRQHRFPRHRFYCPLSGPPPMSRHRATMLFRLWRFLVSIGIRPDRSPSQLAAGPEAFSDSIGSVCPVLLEHLTAQVWDDGKTRKTSTLSVFFEDGVFKVWLNDRDLEQGACVAGATLLQALTTLDRKLEAGDLDWRKSHSKKR